MRLDDLAIVWTTLGGGRKVVSVPARFSHDPQLVAEAIDKALHMGWTPPRWWQFWRWSDDHELPPIPKPSDHPGMTIRDCRQLGPAGVVATCTLCGHETRVLWQDNIAPDDTMFDEWCERIPHTCDACGQKSVRIEIDWATYLKTHIVRI